MARVLVGVTGGIAAYKACELVRLLVRAGHEVVPLVTSGADRFVRAETFHALAHRGPILVAPAMNARMWSHPATQENVVRLQERGVELIGPEEGELAEGESGVGRMAEPEAISARRQELLRPPSLTGR